MARGDCERAFGVAAAADGIVLEQRRHAWLNRLGHMGLPDAAAPVVPLLARIFDALGGDIVAWSAKAVTPLPNDFFHARTGTLVEIDETQHFTTARLLTLDMYPTNAPLGFDSVEYRELCEVWRASQDGYFRTKSAVGFGVGGRTPVRAFNDALRDLAAPLLDHPPVVRVPTVDRDGFSLIPVAPRGRRTPVAGAVLAVALHAVLPCIVVAPRAALVCTRRALDAPVEVGHTDRGWPSRTRTSYASPKGFAAAAAAAFPATTTAVG